VTSSPVVLNEGIVIPTEGRNLKNPGFDAGVSLKADTCVVPKNPGFDAGVSLKADTCIVPKNPGFDAGVSLKADTCVVQMFSVHLLTGQPEHRTLNPEP